MRFLVLYNKKPNISEWANNRFDFDFKRISFDNAPRYIQSDGDDVIDAKWLVAKCDTSKYDGVIAYVKGDVLKGVWGTHIKFKLGDKRFSVIQAEHHDDLYRKPKGVPGFIKMVSTKEETPYPQAEYTFNHELVHAYKYLKGENDLLHTYIKFGKYDEYLASIPEKKTLPLKDWNTTVSQSYGVYNPLLYPTTGYHWGVDHAVGEGTPIYAPFDGYLREDTTGVDALGKHCLYSFWHNKKLYTLLFAHLSKVEDVGMYERGEIIAYTGSSGLSTGPHLHTELWFGLIVDRSKIRKLTTDPIYFFEQEL